MKKGKEISPQKWGMCALGILVLLVAGVALLTYIVDPYFHYHAPIKGINYRLYEQQYINDGIARHFDYDTIIIGNSLSENMRTSQVDELFDCTSIKIPYSGAGYKELWGNIDRALQYNPDVKRVFVIVDTEDAARGKDYVRYTDYPEYLYDDTLWNDAEYLWNKDTLYRGTIYNLLMTLMGKESTSFDEYSAKEEATGAEAIKSLLKVIPAEEEITIREYDEADEQIVRENINENIVKVARTYPDTEFVLLYAPASIVKWARYYSRGEVDYRIEVNRTATEAMLQQENIVIYSFQNEFELLCNLDNYRDTIHFTTEVSEYMIDRVANGKECITWDNYQEYYKDIEEFYTEYDYRALQAQ